MFTPEELETELVGVFEVAQMAAVTSQAVGNWRSRFADFPAPAAELRSGPVFRRGQIRRWLKRRRVQMATVISTINLKGGVGKTSTTVAVAEMLGAVFHKKVLVIDLDPQTNITTVLIGEVKWADLNSKGHTLAQLFKDALADNGQVPKFDLAKTLQRNVSSVATVVNVDLLPSSLDLIDIQDRLATMPRGKYFTRNPVEILRSAIKPIQDEYDYVLIDCPPNLGLITLNGLRISSGYIIPTIPDPLSTYGIPQILNRVEDFSREIGESIPPLGIVITKFREQARVHHTTMARLRRQNKPPVFKTVIPENAKMAEALDYVHANTMRQKYGYQGQFDLIQDLTKEIMGVVEAVGV